MWGLGHGALAKAHSKVPCSNWNCTGMGINCRFSTVASDRTAVIDTTDALALNTGHIPYLQCVRMAPVVRPRTSDQIQSIKGSSLEVFCIRQYRVGRVEDGVSIHALLEWQLEFVSCNHLLWYRLNIP
jgi:hypothetical protein